MTVSVRSYDVSDGETLRHFSTHDFTTEPDDTPPATLYEGRIGRGDGRRAEFVVEREIPRTPSGYFGGLVALRISDIPFMNQDGGLNDFFERSFDGREVIVKSGLIEATSLKGRRFRIDGSGTIVAGRGRSFTGSGDSMVLRLEEVTEQLNKPASTRRYAGTGDDEGPAALANITKPLTLGECFNVEPVLINEANSVFQVSIGRIQGVDVCRDSGLALDGPIDIEGEYSALVAANIPVGSYGVARKIGMIKLGSPPAGIVTCDVRGVHLAKIKAFSALWDGSLLWDGTNPWQDEIDGPGYVSTIAGVTRYLLSEAADWGQNILDAGSFNALDVLQPATIGRHIAAGDEVSIADVLSDLLAGVGTFLIVDRLGKARIGRLDPPASQAPIEVTDSEIIRVDRVDLPYVVPPREWSIGFKPNHRLLNDSDVVAAVSREDRQVFSLPRSKSSTINEDVRLRHRTSSTEEVDSSFFEAADAAAEGVRLSELYKINRRAFEVRLATIGRFHQLGRTIKITHRRHGLESGAHFVIIGVREDFARRLTTLKVFG